MDLTSLAVIVMVAFGVLGADAVLHHDNVIVEVVAPPRNDKIQLDEDTLELTFERQLRAIASTRSLVQPPEIIASRRQGIGMALAEAARLQGVALALKTELGYQSDRLRFVLYMQDNALRGLLSGRGRRTGPFETILTPNDNEPLPDFVRRAATLGAAQLAPYTTALYLLQLHWHDGKFGEVINLIDRAEAKLPPTPVNLERSLYENLRGIVALFDNDAPRAKTILATALAADPSNPVAVLNMAFAEVEVDDYQQAAERMRRLITEAPPANEVLRATAYMTWASAEMGMHQPTQADVLLAKAVELYPTSSTAFDIWAEAKEMEGDKAAAAGLRYKALEATADAFENYAEIAALYFHLSWQPGELSVKPNPYASPGISTYR
jgi:Tfp pilus assembly protein PilF